MRTLCTSVLAMASACGGAPPAVSRVPPDEAPLTLRHVAAAGVNEDTPPVDAIVELAREDVDAGWIEPREVMVEMHGASIYVAAGTPPQRVQILERHGSDLRVGVRLQTARFALWTDTSGLLGTLTRDTQVSAYAGSEPFGGDDAPRVSLRAGARVTVLGKKNGFAHVRYAGALEVDGWVPEASVGSHGPTNMRGGRMPSGARTLTLMPGIAIRVEARWGARVLAVMNRGYFVDDVKDLGEDRHEVAYRDGDVDVYGFATTRDPPEQLHERHAEEPAPLVPTTPNATAASGTCLYGHAGGEPVGFIVGDSAVALDADHGSWWTVTLDTPWGPAVFAAQGAGAADLVACAPAGSVPASGLKPPAPAPAPTAP